MTITVIKRNGEKELLTIEKWQTQIAKVCRGIADVSQSMIEIKAQPHFYDGITTQSYCEGKHYIHIKYVRVKISMLYWIKYNTPP